MSETLLFGRAWRRFTLLAARGKDLPVHGDGLSVRSYLYVEDVAEAFDVVLHRGVLGKRVLMGE
jgi:dTDP-D-glucose 4,6-dehydratase